MDNPRKANRHRVAGRRHIFGLPPTGHRFTVGTSACASNVTTPRSAARPQTYNMSCKVSGKPITESMLPPRLRGLSAVSVASWSGAEGFDFAPSEESAVVVGTSVSTYVVNKVIGESQRSADLVMVQSSMSGHQAGPARGHGLANHLQEADLSY